MTPAPATVSMIKGKLRCDRCGKVAYPTEEHALEAEQKMPNSMRVYFNDNCGWYHLARAKAPIKIVADERDNMVPLVYQCRTRGEIAEAVERLFRKRIMRLEIYNGRDRILSVTGDVTQLRAAQIKELTSQILEQKKPGDER